MLVTLKSILMAHKRVILPNLQGRSIFRDSRTTFVTCVVMNMENIVTDLKFLNNFVNGLYDIGAGKRETIYDRCVSKCQPLIYYTY